LLEVLILNTCQLLWSFEGALKVRSGQARAWHEI
jgi:hypothetical protein